MTPSDKGEMYNENDEPRTLHHSTSVLGDTSLATLCTALLQTDFHLLSNLIMHHSTDAAHRQHISNNPPHWHGPPTYLPKETHNTVPPFRPETLYHIFYGVFVALAILLLYLAAQRPHHPGT